MPNAPDRASTDPLVWIDCEMTGLDVDTDEIISLCCFITDAQLNLLDDHGFEAVVHLDQSRLDAMDEWCTATHARTGLTQASIASTTTAQEAADGLLAYIEKYVPRSRRALLAGNSVHTDKAFLRKPPFDSVIRYLHYRILDVSSIHEAARRWASPGLLDQAPLKDGLHQAREDILDSIREARFYRDVFFTPTEKGAAPEVIDRINATGDKGAEDT
ncbi:Phosphatidylinositol 3,4,5-trisphosphate-dependent Rac exchanger 2 protein [Xanthoria parietina]